MGRWHHDLWRKPEELTDGDRTNSWPYRDAGSTNYAGKLMGRLEEAGTWPESIRRVIYAMIPKSKAENEAQLRPKGLLPYIYRVWMAIRKHQSRDWSLP